jgi:hypothetical protein
MRRPVFSWRRAIVTVVTVTVAAAGVLQWLVTTQHFWAKLEILGAVVAASVMAVLLPFVFAWLGFVKFALKEVSEHPERLRQRRAETWLAVETNARFLNREIEMLRLRQDGHDVEILLNVGAYDGVKGDMMFEIAAIPDMAVYGVARVRIIEDDKSWCVLDSREGRPEFASQMRERLASGEVVPPQGYRVQPFMARSYFYVLESVGTSSDPTQFRTTTAEPEEGHERERG